MQKLCASLKCNNTKIIVACRLQVYQDEKFKTLSLFSTCVCNFLTDDVSLSKTDKSAIAKVYLKSESTEIEDLYDLHDFFPLLCKMYYENPKLNVRDFFIDPFLVYETEVKNLKINGRMKYCALALCIMFNNNIKEEWLNEEEIPDNIRKVIEHTCEACRVDRGTSRLLLQDELDSLCDTFVRKEFGIYRTTHNKLFDVIVYYIGNDLLQCIIRNADGKVIKERFLVQEERNDRNLIIVPERYQSLYLKRLVDDWSKGHIQDVFENHNMTGKTFRETFLCHIQSIDDETQRLLAGIRDDMNNDTALLQCCFIGDIDLCRWCLRESHNVNHTRRDGTSPLYLACEKGHIELVYMLLYRKANINTESEKSPLFIAFENNFTEIVRILLLNMEDINECIPEYGMSILHIACLEGKPEIVEMLLNKNTDFNNCTTNGESPLFFSCRRGHTEIVSMLLNNKADVNKCTNDSTSPLYIACREGYENIVEMLLDKNADVNKCTSVGESPLFVACQEGHKRIVWTLLRNSADIGKCTSWDGETPLYIACQKGHIEIVEMLLENSTKEDVHKLINTISPSPLKIACWKGHKGVVHLLLQYNADVNQFEDEKDSPMYIACKKGYLEIVSLLLPKVKSYRYKKKWRITVKYSWSKRISANSKHVVERI